MKRERPRREYTVDQGPKQYFSPQDLEEIRLKMRMTPEQFEASLDEIAHQIAEQTGYIAVFTKTPEGGLLMSKGIIKK